ncbi:hypothetical protein D3P08_21505 [Paenibacillus nanensis]|uniref:SLH domain-containing protein n=1 Tax=Paenibacillus nanensis TaxID=393251 RepID=A0A3A1UNI4_9BACL|nr:S-layer homology domain-containing protein [Paenibacillus nanensis]RIX50127.1 hypothetical protein D3P08_21505 [Paenibacillus nanensis]
MKLFKVILASGLICSLSYHTTIFANESSASNAPHYLSEDHYDLVLERNTPSPEIRDHWAKDLFIWADRNRILHGYADGTYQPDRMASEAEFLKLLMKTLEPALLDSVGHGWEESPYSLAETYNLPAKGLQDSSFIFKPINRQTAAEIITGITGVHYTGEEAVSYLWGNKMIPSRLAPTFKAFDGNATITRAEVLEWLRVISLRGYWGLHPRPDEPSDPEKLPGISTGSTEDPPYFSFTPINKDDLDLYNEEGHPVLTFGMKKTDIERQFGLSEDTDVFRNYLYSQFTVGYDTRGDIDFWNIDDNQFDNENIAELETSKGISVTKSTLFDVLDAYGTGGYEGHNYLAYYYEEDNDGHLHAVTNPKLIRHNNKGYVLSFLIDEETKKVWYISVSTYHNEFYEFFEH